MPQHQDATGSPKYQDATGVANGGNSGNGGQGSSGNNGGNSSNGTMAVDTDKLTQAANDFDAIAKKASDSYNTLVHKLNSIGECWGTDDEFAKGFLNGSGSSPGYSGHQKLLDGMSGLADSFSSIAQNARQAAKNYEQAENAAMGKG